MTGTYTHMLVGAHTYTHIFFFCWRRIQRLAWGTFTSAPPPLVSLFLSLSPWDRDYLTPYSWESHTRTPLTHPHTCSHAHTFTLFHLSSAVSRLSPPVPLRQTCLCFLIQYAPSNVLWIFTESDMKQKENSPLKTYVDCFPPFFYHVECLWMSVICFCF